MPDLTHILGYLSAAGGAALLTWLIAALTGRARRQGAADAAGEFDRRVVRFKQSVLKSAEDQRSAVVQRDNARIRAGLTSADAEELVRGRGDADSGGEG